MEGKADNSHEMPMGFSFQLGLNEKALSAYAKLDDQEKRHILEAARKVQSKSEMRRIVEGLERKF